MMRRRRTTGRTVQTEPVGDVIAALLWFAILCGCVAWLLWQWDWFGIWLPHFSLWAWPL